MLGLPGTMRLRVISLFFLWSCGLNPQPFPPDTLDGSASDASLTASPDAAGGVDSSADDGAVPSGGDAESDAEATDASDASDASDGGDARDDDASDAEDGG